MALKRFFVNATIAAASLLATIAGVFAAGEAILHWKFGAVPPGPPSEWNRYDPLRGWSLLPGRYSYLDVGAMRRVDVAINDLGLRNAPLQREPKPGVERITILGDSFVFGPPVNVGETVTGQLQELAGPGYEIVNAGVSGYGTGQEYRLAEELQAKGYSLGRKLVLVFFTNDIEDNLGLNYSTLGRNPKQPVYNVDADGHLQQTRIAPWPEVAGQARGGQTGPLFLPFLIYQAEVVTVSYPAILQAVTAIGVKPPLPRTPGIIAGWYGAGWKARWSTTEAVLTYAIAKLRAMPRAPELSIAFVPSPFQIHDAFRRVIEADKSGDERYASFLADTDRPQRMVLSVARRMGVQFIDLTPELRRAARTSVLYFPREGHFNKEGNAVAAGVIYRQVIANTAEHGM